MRDWVDSYLSDDRENSRREMRLSDLAVQGAPLLFQELAAQIESDVAKWENAKHYGVRYESSPSSKFTLRSPSGKLPYARMDVDLVGLDIVCTMTRKRDSTCSPETLPLLRFRISSDLTGNVQIFKNGTPIEDESALSKELLLPFFDYLRASQVSSRLEVAV